MEFQFQRRIKMASKNLQPLKASKPKGLVSPATVAAANEPDDTTPVAPVLRIRGAAMANPKTSKGRRL
jgi:hypothetical protein